MCTIPTNKPLTKASYDFLMMYCKEKGVREIWDLFSKEELVDYISLDIWDYDVHDEMETGGKTQDEAVIVVGERFLSMKRDALLERISIHNQWELIRLKAKELGFGEELER